MTTLTATYQPGLGKTPPGVLLQVASAPSQAPAYASNFATVDGWAATQSGVLTLVTPVSTGIPSASMVSRPDNLSTFTRTVTGLSIGQTYEFSLYYVTNSGRIQLGVAGIGVGTSVYNAARAVTKYTFTATATSHVLNIIANPPATIATDYGDVVVDSILVRRISTWRGTVITRTDANGTNIPVRVPPGLDATGTSGSATMTVTDYEQALAGPVVYTVTDGNNATASATPFGAHTNVITNPSVEVDTLNWQTVLAGTTLERSTEQADVGTASIKCTVGTGTGQFLRTALISAGQDITGRLFGFRARVRPAAAATYRVSIRFLGSDGATTIAYVDGPDTACPAGQWTTLSVTGAAPAGSYGYRPNVNRPTDLAAGSVVYVDATLMREYVGTFDPADYFDGDTAGCAWAGTAHASPSVRPDPATDAATNLVPNPSIETNDTGWNAYGAGVTRARSIAQASVGVAALAIVTGTSNLSGVFGTLVPGVAGRSYGLRMRARADAVSDLRVSIQFLDAASLHLGFAVSEYAATPANTWVTVSAAGVAPAGTTQVRAWLQRANSTTAGVTVYLDAALLREYVGTFDPADYFDGTTPGCYWTGVAHGSTSVRAATANAPAPGVWISLPATTFAPGVPSAVQAEAVLTVTESSQVNASVHQVVGRADPLVNPGPLSTRTGTVEVWCSTYATADTLRALFAAGAVAMLRQPDFPGMDLYLVAARVDVTNETPTQRWKASISYVEVVAP